MSKPRIPKVKMSFLLPCFDYYKERRSNLSEILKELEIPAASLEVADGEISSSVYHRAYALVADRLNDKHLGASIGWRWASGEDPFGASLPRQSLGRSLYKVLRRFPRNSTSGRFELNITADRASLLGERFERSPVPTSQGDVCLISYLINLIKFRSRAHFCDSDLFVQTPHAPFIPEWLLKKQSLLPGAHNKLSIRFPSYWLFTEGSFHDEEFIKDLELSHGPRATDLRQHVRTFIKDHLVSGAYDLKSVAESSGQSPRQFQRHLKSMGTSYRTLEDEARLEIAVDLLSTSNFKVLDVARMAGFDNSTSFSRWFRKQTGHSPSQYARALPADTN